MPAFLYSSVAYNFGIAPTFVIKNGLNYKMLGHTDIKVTFDTYSDVFESFQAESVQKVDNYMKYLGLEAKIS